MFASTMDEFSTNAQNRLVDHDASPSERQFAMWMHLALLGNLVAPIVILIAPLAMWMTRKEDSPFLDDHGREAVNFQISLLIYMLALVPLIAILTCGVGALLIPGVYVLGLIGMIMAAKAASRGEFYRYPMSIRFL
ncbi:MAG: DUF4870 domain-containing protein [Phycisphaerales bacterium]|nr:DUF4870 domain-containing protein [Phycisphaerales bacterium]